MKNRTTFIAIMISASIGWWANDFLTPWNIRSQSSLFAWAEKLKTMNSIGRDGVLNGDPTLFDARGSCLPNAKLALLSLDDDEVTAIYRCREFIAGVDVIGELAVRIGKDENFTSYALGFLPSTNDPGMGEIARLGPS